MKQTDKQSTSANLRQSEERYQSLFHSNHSAMLLIDPDTGDIEDANNAACTYYGWSHHEICRKKISEINALSPEEVMVEMQKAKDIKQDYFLFKHVLANGQVRDVEVFSGPIKFGSSTLLFSIIHDVTEQLKLQYDLNERIKELNCHTRISELVSNKTLSVDEVCKEMVHLIVDSMQFPNLTQGLIRIDEKIYQTTGFQASRNFLRQEIKSKGRVIGSVEVCLPDDMLPSAEGLFLPEESSLLHSMAERLASFIELKEADHILSESEEKYFKAFQTSPYAIIISRAEDGKIVDVNRAFSSFSGYSRDEAIEDSTIRLNLWVYPEERNRVVKSLMEGNEIVAEEFQFNTKTGEILTGLFSAHIIMLNNEEYILSSINDITPSKQAEHQLRVSEEKYRNIFERMQDVYYEASLEGILLEISPSIHRISKGQYTREEVIGKSLDDIYVSPDDQDAFFSELFKRGSLTDYELLLLNKDGSVVPIAISAGLIYNKDGQPEKITGILRDVTERKLAYDVLEKNRKKLQESEALYHSILLASPDDITITDLEGNITFISPQGLTMFGYENAGQVTGRNLAEFVLPEDQERAMAEIARMHRGEEVLPADYRAIRTDNTVFNIEVNGAFIRNTGGEPTNMVFIVRDISTRISAEKNLLENQKIFRVLNNLMSDYIFKLAVQSDGHFNMSIIAGNYDKATGRAAENVTTPADWYKAIHPDDLSNLFDHFNRIIELKKPIEIECRSFSEDGQLRWLEVIATPETDPFTGKVVSIYGSIRNITMKKLAAQELLESKNKYYNLVENLHTGVVVHRSDTSILFCNLEASELLGISQDQLENKVAADPNWYFMDESGRKLLPEEYPVTKVIATKSPLLNRTYGINRPVTFDVIWVQLNAYPEFGEEEGLLQQVVVTFNNITERKQSEQILHTRLRLNEFAQFHTKNEIQQKLLDELELLTGSEISFFHSVFADEESLTLQNLSTHTLQTMAWAEGKGLHFNICQSGVSADCLAQRKAIIHNDYTFPEHRKGNPDGHALIMRELVVPVFRNDKIVAVVGVGNKPANYQETDKEIVSLLADLAWDITDIKLAQEQINQQNERLSAIVGAMPDLIFVIDKDGAYTEFYSSDSESLLIPAQQIIGTNIRIVFDEEAAKFHLDKISNCILQKKLVTYEYSIGENDAKRYYEARLAPLGTDKVLSIVRNITGRKETEFEIRDLNANLELRIEKRTAQLAETNDNLQNEINERIKASLALQESELKHSSMISNISDVIGIMAIDGIMKYKSPNIEKYFGWKPEDLIGTNGWLTVHPDDLERLQAEFINLVMEDNSSTTVEYKYLCRDGSYKPIELTATNLVHNKAINGVLFNYHDISDRKRAEEQIIKSRDEANKANQAKSEFLSRMSHELRTPMNSILGFGQLLKMGELTPKQKKGVDYILSSGQHLLNLIDEVLDISRIESGKLSLMPEPVHLSSFIGEIMDSVLPLADSRELIITLENTLADELFILCDRKRLRQVLLNLINNAVKYNQPGGAIVISTEALPKDNDGGSSFRISVTDTGPGIQPGDISKLFIPFQRIGAEKTHTEGAGLGLAIVKQLMEAMKGTVGVTSVVGEGSTFWIDLPVNGNLSSWNERVKNSPDKGLQTESVLSGGSSVIDTTGTILYLEDNMQNADLVKEIIETYRPQIRLILSMFGSPAVGLAIKHKPGLILLDLDLPDMNGSDVQTNLRADDKTKSIPVVIVTADATQKQVQDQMFAGARGYLTKPLDVNMFLQVVDEWIRK